MGAFSGLRDAKMYERGTPLSTTKVPNPAYNKDIAGSEPHIHKPNRFVVEIEKCLLKDTRKNGLAFIAELRVLETTDPQAHPVGSKRSWFQKMQDKDVAFGAIKHFAAAVLGFQASDKEAIKKEVEPELEDTMDRACGEENALAGVKVAVEVTHKKTGKGMDFTVHNWEPVAQP